MKDIVVIKLYRNEFSNDDYHDWMTDCYPTIAEELEEYMKNKGKSLYFMCMCSNPLDGAPIDARPFAEIEYTGSFVQDEKEQCLATLKKLSSDIEFYKAKVGKRSEWTYREFSTLTLVRIRKIKDDEELLELSESDVECYRAATKKEEK